LWLVVVAAVVKYYNVIFILGTAMLMRELVNSRVDEFVLVAKI